MATSYFWFATLQTPNARGFYLSSHQGIRDVQPGQTRMDLFNSIRDEIYRNTPQARGGAVIAFDIQPNELEASQ
jgi:hypothetical protein